MLVVSERGSHVTAVLMVPLFGCSDGSVGGRTGNEATSNAAFQHTIKSPHALIVINCTEILNEDGLQYCQPISGRVKPYHHSSVFSITTGQSSSPKLDILHVIAS